MSESDTSRTVPTSIPHICHLNHLYIGGEKLVMWRNFRFQYMTDVEKSEISPRVEEFQIFHTTDVEKSEILPNLEEFQNSTHDRCEEI